jgi:hypothetical protein
MKSGPWLRRSLRKNLRKSIAIIGCITLATSLVPASTSANYTTSYEMPGVGHDHGTAQWNDSNVFVQEGVDFSSETIGQMMKKIESFDFAAFADDHQNLPWLDELLVNKGVIPDDIADEGSANTLFSRGSALYMKSQDNSKLGFVGQVHYADTLNQDKMVEISLSTGAVTENKAERKNYPSHGNYTYSSGPLQINQQKFITYGNSAVTLLEFTNPSSQPITFTLTVKSPFVNKVEGEELIGERVAAPLMISTEGAKVVKAMSYVDVHLSGNGLNPVEHSKALIKEITVPSNGKIEQRVVMGWLAEEIPASKTEYEQWKAMPSNAAAFEAQVKAYNAWWADNIPYIDIPDENVKKVLYYRWWCNRFNLLDANIPGNDWQFPMNMEGVLGYNNGITVSVPWALQDLKWLRNPAYAYGTWLAQGEYSENKNYKNNPGRPNIWTWDMMQNISQVGWEAYKIYGGGNKILKKFADIAANDVTGTLSHFKGTDPSLVYYNHGPMTGNDGDTVSMHWNGGGNYARLDGSATTYGNAVATAEMYQELGETSNANNMETIGDQIRQSILTKMWFDGNDFDGDGKPDSNGQGSFLHKKTVGGQDVFVPWRDNNLFVFNFGVVPTALEANYKAKYLSQLADYGDPNYYPIFPFFTADQHSIMKRVQDYVDGKTNAYGTDQFAWCNFGNYINTITASLRQYPVQNINADTYKQLFDWGAWLHTVEPGNTDHLDSNEFFWLEDYYFGTPWTKDNPPNPSGKMVRAWIHHDTLGMMNYTVMEDIAGLQPRTDEKIELWPIGINYDYFAVDNVRYHDADLSIVWQDPAKFSQQPHYQGIPAGFSLFINGERVMTTNELSHVIFDTATGKVILPEGDITGAVGSNAETEVIYEKGSSVTLASSGATSLSSVSKVVDMFNKAGIDIVHHGANLATLPTTQVTSTYIKQGSNLAALVDGSTIASTKHTSNTALFGASPNKEDTITFNFEEPQMVDNVKVYFFNDRLQAGYGTPQQFGVEYLAQDGVTWKPVEGQFRYPALIASNYNDVQLTAVNTAAIRITVTHSLKFATGIKEIQIYNNQLTNVQPAVNQAPRIVLERTTYAVGEGEEIKLIPTIYDDGLPNGELTYQWSKVSGEGEPEQLDVNEPIFKAVFPAVGKYVYRLTVSDGELSSSIDVEFNVAVATQDIENMLAPYASRDGGKIVRNGDDFTSESWIALEEAIGQAKALLATENYTAEQINAARTSLQSAISGLKYKNLALLANASTSYVSPWESLKGINDGFIPYTSGNIGKPEEEVQYGNWADAADEHFLQYEWSQPVKLSQSSIYFFDDGGGVQLPADYTIEYWDDSLNDFMPVTNVQGKTIQKNTFNTVSFDETTTTKLRLVLVRQPSVWTGVKEWRVWGSQAIGRTDIISAENIEVDTIVGALPTLPDKVKVTYSDHTTGFADVTWNEVPFNEVTTAHTFQVLGKIVGTSINATCLVTVKYDKRELVTAIEEANEILEHKAQYEATEQQWESLELALAQANEVNERASATEGEITNALQVLQAALAVIQQAN